MGGCVWRRSAEVSAICSSTARARSQEWPTNTRSPMAWCAIRVRSNACGDVEAQRASDTDGVRSGKQVACSADVSCAPIISLSFSRFLWQEEPESARKMRVPAAAIALVQLGEKKNLFCVRPSWHIMTPYAQTMLPQEERSLRCLDPRRL